MFCNDRNAQMYLSFHRLYTYRALLRGS
uniref:Uncharacterized protein n=1 Tax=Anguilla anguilla TaxID=7936 RepID=A0A0E9VS91_ANGAN